MGSPTNYVVCFDRAYENEGRNPTPYRYHERHFTITPPIQVHDTDFLNRALKRATDGAVTGPGGRAPEHHFGGLSSYPFVRDVTLTFSDNSATHGVAEIHGGANPEDVTELIIAASTDELSPLGTVAVKFGDLELTQT